MDRNNDEKLGVKSPSDQFKETMDSASKPQEHYQEPIDRGLVFVNPTKLVELPSRGKKYDVDHPLYDSRTIEIKQMTTNQENILTNKTLAREGESVDKFLSSIIVDRRVDSRSLLSGDREAIIIMSRIYGYGAKYGTEIQCPSCAKAISQSFDLNKAVESGLEALEQIGEVEEEYGIKWTSNRTFSMKLDVCGWTVECKILDGYDDKKQFQEDRALETKKKRDPNHPLVIEEKNSSDLLNHIIVSIDGNDDFGPRKSTSVISKAVDSMPTIDTVVLRDVYKLINPRIALLQSLYCSNCRYEGVVDIPVNENFFRTI